MLGGSGVSGIRVPVNSYMYRVSDKTLSQKTLEPPYPLFTETDGRIVSTFFLFDKK
jgi:hypothetical protein